MTNRIDSIWDKIDKRSADECWPWTGYKNSKNKTYAYGRLDIMGRKGVYAHRVAYLSANPGSITLDKKDEIMVLHKCDNPACCNPSHLFLGTHADNMRDKAEKGRAPRLRGVNGVRSKLTENDVREIRRMKKEGATKKALAMLYEVSEATISGACYGRYYQDVI